MKFYKFRIIFIIDSLPHDGRPASLLPLAQSTPQRPETGATSSHLPGLQPIVDFGNDEIFDMNGTVGPVGLSTNLQDGLNQIQSQMNPDIRDNLERVGNSLDNHEIERVQSLQPDPNELQPIRRDPVPRVSVRENCQFSTIKY